MLELMHTPEFSYTKKEYNPNFADVTEKPLVRQKQYFSLIIQPLVWQKQYSSLNI